MGKQQRHTAETCSRDKQCMQQGHEAYTCRVDMQHGHAALTSSMDMQVSVSKRDSMEIKHGNAARA
jgi:hypothetical protein